MAEVKLKATIGDFKSDLWRFHLVIPEQVASTFVKGRNRRVVCILPDGDELHTAFMPNKGRWFILLNGNMARKYKLAEGATLDIRLIPETAEYGVPLPDELMATLDQDEQASAAFQALTPGKRRSLIYIVNKVKSPESRISKALAIARHLNEAGTDLDYKRLNELIKEYNQLRKNG